MTRRKRCPRCLEKVPYTIRQCIRCGADPGDSRLWARRRAVNRVTAAIVVVVLAVGALLAVSYSDRYLPAMADWYTDKVLGTESGAMHRLVEPDGREAFYACARAVVKRLDGPGSVATFEEAGTVATEAMGSDRFRLRSQVEEALESGEVVQRSFTCIARLDGARWRVEELTVGRSG